MPIEVTMPKLSPTMETGVITQWLVKVGDAIKEGDVLADIETDKATMQMKAYDDGTVVHIDHPAGAEVALGERVLVLARKNEDAKQVASALGLGKAAAAPPAPKAKAGTTPRNRRLAPTGTRRPRPRLRRRGPRAMASRRRTAKARTSPRLAREGSRSARWPARWRRRRASIWGRSAAPAPAGVSSAATSRQCSVRRCRRHRPAGRPALEEHPLRRQPRRRQARSHRISRARPRRVPRCASHTRACGRRSRSG